MFIALLFEEHGCSEIARMSDEDTCAKKSTAALSLLGDLKILYGIVVEEIANHHFGLGSAVCI
jgi:hypothetical protein